MNRLRKAAAGAAAVRGSGSSSLSPSSAATSASASAADVAGNAADASIETNSNRSSTTNSSSTATSTPTGGKKPPVHHHAKAKKAKANAAHASGASGGLASAIARRCWFLPFGRQFFAMSVRHVLIGSVCLFIASYYGYLGYLETRVNTPFDEQRVVAPDATAPDADDRYWGTYRPGTYFGLKTRDPHSPVVGLMWFSPGRLQPGGLNLRHWCEVGDGLQRYGWNQHDGRTFGVQDIRDEAVRLQTSFVKFPNGKHGGDWTARIEVGLNAEWRGARKQHDDIVSLIWYTALDGKNGHIAAESSSPLIGVRGHTRALGDFAMHLHASNGTILHTSYLSTVADSLKDLHLVTRSNMRLMDDSRAPFGHWITLNGDVLTDANGDRLSANFIATMITGRPPFTVDVTYKSISGLTPDMARHLPATGSEYTEILRAKRAAYEERFEQTFGLQAKGYSPAEVRFAESALSNMIGGIGYFYGSSRVQSEHTPEPVPYWKAPLYTAVPSRSFFPRGFLWDEGFHGLLIAAWDVDIELDIMAHWFDLMNREGWIPREQILGAEALAKVPEEFVTQRNRAANPPTFFLTLKAILARGNRPKLRGYHLQTLERMYPRLQAWFTWFNGTQRGEQPGTYRWRGRETYSDEELNPKTLTSGLDDYPRASHPSDAERHVDLRCWIAMAAGVMAELSRLLERDDFRYLETYYYLSDNQLLNDQHMSPYTLSYSDYGLHTDAVTLRWEHHLVKHQAQQTSMHAHQQHQRKVRVTAKQPELRYVDTTFGYVSLFPFLLEILTPDAKALDRILEQLRDPAVLWTKFGLRSLSKASPLYMKRNTENDPPYWRGQIWLNINYLALRALHHYGSVPGPYSERARTIYVDLRQNIVRNVIAQYERTGFVWEQYNDSTGAGSGCKPFTGWSALTVLMMAEQF